MCNISITPVSLSLSCDSSLGCQVANNNENMNNKSLFSNEDLLDKRATVQSDELHTMVIHL